MSAAHNRLISIPEDREQVHQREASPPSGLDFHDRGDDLSRPFSGSFNGVGASSGTRLTVDSDGIGGGEAWLFGIDVGGPSRIILEVRFP